MVLWKDDFDKADDKASRFVATNQVESSEGEVSRKRKKRKVTSKPVFEVPDEAFNQGEVLNYRISNYN